MVQKGHRGCTHLDVPGGTAGRHACNREDHRMSIEVVSGSVSTVTGLGKDEAWLRDWLRDEPDRLGLGQLESSDEEAADDRSFVATDDGRCFSVNVQLGEMEAGQAFGVLESWARSRAVHPDKQHVAVLVTETLSDRYQSTLEALTEHLPLVVVELQVWQGKDEAIVVPHVALASDEVDLSDTPAAKAAEAVAKVAAAEAVAGTTWAETEVDDAVSELDAAEAEAAVEAEAEAEAEAAALAEAEAEDIPEDKDDTGVGNPWGLDETAEDGAFQPSGSGSTGLLSKVGN